MLHDQLYRVEEHTVKTGEGYEFALPVMSGPDCVTVCPVIGDYVVVVRQHRYVLGMETFELPAGHVEPGQSPEQAAAAELREETGFTAGSFVALGSSFATGGIKVRSYAFIATDLRETVNDASVLDAEPMLFAWSDALALAAETDLMPSTSQAVLLSAARQLGV